MVAMGAMGEMGVSVRTVATAARFVFHSVGGGVPEKLPPFSGLALGSGSKRFFPLQSGCGCGYGLPQGFAVKRPGV